ncbi:MAG: RNA polymerase sigma factor [Vulcanimicrobiaceae bacterium]
MTTKCDPTQVDRLFRTESAQAVARLARYFNDFERAEDAVQDAYLIALERWPRDGLPRSPAAWIVTAARNCAIDRLRRERVAATKYEQLVRLETALGEDGGFDEPMMDDRLAMIFTACHPALSLETRIALTLRFAAGFTVGEIASALLVAQPTIAQRLVRAKRKIREARILFVVPEAPALPERLADVLRVLYLIFNEGYASSTHATRVRADLCDEALRLVTLLEQLLPSEPEISGLHALMLFHDARRATRVDENDDAVLLEDQDRSCWDARKIVRGLTLLDNALRYQHIGPYQVQAAIAAEHARAESFEATNWFRIRRWYDALQNITPSPIVALNRSVAIAYTEGCEAALHEVDAIVESGELDDYAPLFTSRAEYLRRLERFEESREFYDRALALTQSDSDRRFIEKRLREIAAVQGATGP